MLALSRKPKQAIVFPDLGITVHVVEVSGHTVRLAIDAPRHIRVLRDEHTPHEQGGSHADAR